MDSKAFDLFVVYAAADGDFARGYLLPALGLPPSRVLLIDDLTPGAPLIAEIERGVYSVHAGVQSAALGHLHGPSLTGDERCL